MHITIGILAHNEERLIERTLHSLLQQSVFHRQEASTAWEILVVPNGCTDETAVRAKACLAAKVPSLPVRNVTYRVESLARPGKSNAWNELVHRLASPATDVFVMLDADIEFGHIDTIRNCVDRLLADAHARVVVDLPLKDFTRKPKLSLLERLSARTSTLSMEGHPAIAGSFYCARSEFMRQVWMPLDISVEDGFLYAMATTDCFRTQPDPSRVVRAENASHYFEGLVKPSQLLKHEVRLTIGTTLNCFLCWDTLLFITPKDGPGAGELVRDLNRSYPDWYRAMMSNQVRARGRWVLPFNFLVRRFHSPRRLSAWEWSKRLPVRLAASLFDVFVFIIANRKLRAGTAIGIW